MAIETLTNQINSTISIDTLREMISRLSTTENGESLKDAMSKLKKALLENPDAAALMIPEDIGGAVAALRRMTRTEVADSAVTKKGTSRKKADFTPEEEKEIEEKLFDEG